MKIAAMLVAVSLGGSLPPTLPYRTGNTSAKALEPIEQAKREFDEGSAAYALGRYPEAVRHFERSFELSRRKELLFNLGQAYAHWYEVSADRSHLRRAKQLFENYAGSLDEQADKDRKSRADVAKRLAAIERELQALDHEQPKEKRGLEDRPLHKKAWFWGTIAGVVVLGAAATTTGILLSRRNRQGSEPELGTIGTATRAPGAGVAIRF